MTLEEKYPELEKLRIGRPKTEIIHQFLEFVREECGGMELCGRSDEGFIDLPTRDVDAAMAKFIDVDMNKVELERRAILDECDTGYRADKVIAKVDAELEKERHP